ncbi:MAG: T9SS type A sorting domain-containing protein [Candidatus Kapabacteria bacterium]|nr:T9SS type A sorting domain-containing protein [Candidatus Kapabacteria bacterium]
MNTNKPNIEDYFNEARQQEPLFDKDYARGLIEKNSESFAIYKQPKKGISAMNIIISTLSLAAAVGFFTFNNSIFESNKIDKPVNTIAMQQTLQPTNTFKNKSLTNPTLNANENNLKVGSTSNKSQDVASVAEDDSSIDCKAIIIKKCQTINSCKPESVIKSTYKNVGGILDNKKINVKGVHVIKLSEEEISKLGINTECLSDNASLSFVDYWSENPQVCTVYQNGGFVSKDLKENYPSSATRDFGLKMVTDNSGNRRVAVFDDKDINLHFLHSDNQYFANNNSTSKNVYVPITSNDRKNTISRSVSIMSSGGSKVSSSSLGANLITIDATSNDKQCANQMSANSPKFVLYSNSIQVSKNDENSINCQSSINNNEPKNRKIVISQKQVQAQLGNSNQKDSVLAAIAKSLSEQNNLFSNHDSILKIIEEKDILINNGNFSNISDSYKPIYMFRSNMPNNCSDSVFSHKKVTCFQNSGQYMIATSIGSNSDQEYKLDSDDNFKKDVESTKPSQNIESEKAIETTTMITSDVKIDNPSVKSLKIVTRQNNQNSALGLSKMIFNIRCDTICSDDNLIKLESYDSSKPIVRWIQVDMEKQFEKHVLINKLIPVAIRICKNTTDNSSYEFIAWFEPTPDFINKLPQSIREQIGKEIEYSNKSSEICQNSTIAGENPIFDIWRSCSGAIENLAVYPNPTKTIVKVQFNLKDKRTITVSLHDVFGSKIASLAESQQAEKGTFNGEYKLENIKPGMYLVVVQSENGEQAVQRIIVEQ